MIDVEVIRLRRLRNTALRVRAIALALEANAVPRNSVLSRSAQNCWRIARVITGVLRAHPNLSYQREYSPLRAAYHRVSAGWHATVAVSRGRGAQLLGEELWRVARGLDDARALTWSAELSDTLGRAQLQMRTLLREMDVTLRPRLVDGRGHSNAAAGNWPYLAL